MKLITAALVLASFPLFAEMKGDCWVKTREDHHIDANLNIRSAEVAPLYRALKSIEEIVRRNPHFVTFPDMRYRSHIYIGGGTPRLAHLNAIAYKRSGWTGVCDLIPQADRIDAGEGGVSFAINQLQQIMGSPIVKDGVLTAYIEPQLDGNIDGNPLFDKYHVLLTVGKRLPWVPVTLGEYLAFRERELERRIAEFRTSKAQRTGIVIDDAEVKKTYAEFKKTNPKAAEDYLKMMEGLKKAAPGISEQAQKYDVEIEKRFADEKASLAAYKNTRSAQELAAQVRTGTGPHGVAAPGDKNPYRWVRENPDFGWDRNDPNRIQLIVVYAPYVGDLDAHPYNPILARTLETIDYAAVQKLLR